MSCVSYMLFPAFTSRLFGGPCVSVRRGVVVLSFNSRAARLVKHHMHRLSACYRVIPCGGFPGRSAAVGKIVLSKDPFSICSGSTFGMSLDRVHNGCPVLKVYCNTRFVSCAGNKGMRPTNAHRCKHTRLASFYGSGILFGKMHRGARI